MAETQAVDMLALLKAHPLPFADYLGLGLSSAELDRVVGRLPFARNSAPFSTSCMAGRWMARGCG